MITMFLQEKKKKKGFPDNHTKSKIHLCINKNFYDTDKRFDLSIFIGTKDVNLTRPPTRNLHHQ